VATRLLSWENERKVTLTSFGNKETKNVDVDEEVLERRIVGGKLRGGVHV
jgi:hypothetical protein